MRIRLMTLAALAVLAIPVAPAGASTEVEFKDGFPVTSKRRLYPLDAVAVGQRGVGYTVFTGAKVEPFEVEILGVIRGMLGPGKHVILARLHGEKIEFAGVISGMSGSPVFIDGKLVGAVSYRFGAFGKEPIAGITPIESMLAIYSDEVSPTPSPPSVAHRSHGRPSSGELLALPTRRNSTTDDLRPIETPITLGGFPPDVAKLLEAKFVEAGMSTVVGAVSGAIASHQRSPRETGKLDANVMSTAGGAPAAPIAPGTPIAAILMRGDLFVAGTGTVTFVEDGRVLGFGHPFFGYGHVVFPMATASILNTLASMAGSYKQSAPALEVGSILHDRLTAIAGDFERVAEMIPVRVTVVRTDAAKGAAPVTMNVEVVDNEWWAPPMVQSAVMSAGDGRLGLERGGTVEYVAKFVVGDRTIELKDTMAALPPFKLTPFIARDIGEVVSTVLDNRFATAKLERVEVDIRADPIARLSFIEEIVPERRLVRAGETLSIIARVRAYRGPLISLPLTIQIPPDAAGEIDVMVGGATELDRRDLDVVGPRSPNDIDDLLEMLTTRRPGLGLYARTYLTRPGLRSNVSLMSSLPISQRALLIPETGVRRKAVTEALGPATRVDYPMVVSGSLSTKLQVTP